MTDVLSMATEDAEADVAPSDQGKVSVAKLAAKQAALAEEIAILEQAAKDKKKELQRVSEQDLPEAMDAIGMAEFTLIDGTKISVKTFYSASITAERKDDAFAWLEANGHGGIIKTDVSVAFGRGDLEVAKSFLEYARGFNEAAINPELEQGVHWSTLRSFVKEQIEGGHPLPQETFGVYVGRKAELKVSKK